MKHNIFKLQLGEILFFISGLLWLFALPALKSEYGYFLWVGAKVVYFLGFVFFFVNFVLRYRENKNNV